MARDIDGLVQAGLGKTALCAVHPLLQTNATWAKLPVMLQRVLCSCGSSFMQLKGKPCISDQLQKQTERLYAAN